VGSPYSNGGQVGGRRQLLKGITRFVAQGRVLCGNLSGIDGAKTWEIHYRLLQLGAAAGVNASDRLQHSCPDVTC